MVPPAMEPFPLPPPAALPPLRRTGLRLVVRRQRRHPRHTWGLPLRLLCAAAEAASRGQPWMSSRGNMQTVRSLFRHGLVEARKKLVLYAISARGCLFLRHHDRDLARDAARSRKRERRAMHGNRPG